MKFLSVATVAAFLFTQSVFAEKPAKSEILEVQVTEKGFEPSELDAKAGANVVLRITRKTDATCATAIQVPSKKMKKELPLNKAVNVDLGKLEKGEIRFACGMDMVSGKVIVR